MYRIKLWAVCVFAGLDVLSWAGQTQLQMFLFLKFSLLKTAKTLRLCTERTNIWTSLVWDYERLTTLYKSVSGSQRPTERQRVSLRGWKKWDYWHNSGRSWSLALQESQLVELQPDPAHPIQRDELPATRLNLLLQLHLILIFLLSFSLGFSLQFLAVW